MASLEYTYSNIIIIVPTVVVGSIIISAVLILLIIGCVGYYYKKNNRRARSRENELQHLVERERVLSEMRQNELQQQVENMVSQVTVVHMQMKGKYVNMHLDVSLGLTHAILSCNCNPPLCQ